MMDKIISRIADKETLIKNLLGHFSDSERKYSGLLKASDSVLNNDNEANTRKMLSTAMKVLKDQMEINQDMLALLIMLASDDDFLGRQAKLAMKLGSNPQEILQRMWRDKMGKS